ncbi:MAG: hypothetical protein ACON4G_03720 [Candidatus Puniceispirillaceae bacterium]
MSKAIANVRNIRKRGKAKLVRISDQVNNLAWELSEKNDKIKDAHTAKSIAMLDESLTLMQRALGLLNSVAIDPELLVEAPKEPKAQKEAKKGLFSKNKAEAADAEEVIAAPDMPSRAPIASLKPQG